MIQVNTQEAKTKFSYLLSIVETDNEKVKICRNGKPIAALVPISKIHDPLQQHAKLKGVIFHEDPTTPLDNDDWSDELK